MNKLQNAYLRAGVITGGLLGSMGAFAQSADPFDTALSTATTKVTGYAGALVGLAAVSVVFMIAIKYVKKIRSAA